MSRSARRLRGVAAALALTGAALAAQPPAAAPRLLLLRIDMNNL